MKKIYIIYVISILMAFILCGCSTNMSLTDYNNKVDLLKNGVDELGAQEVQDNEPKSTTSTEQVEPVEKVKQVEEVEKATEEPKLVEPEEQAAPEPPPIIETDMFSSFAYMKSFDPQTNIAQFDFFEKLYGPEAMDALMEYEGLSEFDAEAQVMSSGEGWYYVKDVDSKLRSIDLSKVEVNIIITEDGTIQSDLSNLEATSIESVVNIYNKNAAYILNGHYFISVNDSGVAVQVKQVYEP